MEPESLEIQWIIDNAEALRDALPDKWVDTREQEPLVRLGFQLKLLGVDWRTTDQLAKCFAALSGCGLIVVQRTRSGAAMRATPMEPEMWKRYARDMQHLQDHAEEREKADPKILERFNRVSMALIRYLDGGVSWEEALENPYSMGEALVSALEIVFGHEPDSGTEPKSMDPSLN
jgi:hypothetical protein